MDAVLVSGALGLFVGIVSGVVFSPLGLRASHRVPNAPLTGVFAPILGYVALRMFRQSRQQFSGTPVDATRPLPPCLLVAGNQFLPDHKGELKKSCRH